MASSPLPVTIRPLEVAETYEIRRRVLRNNDPGAQLHIREDDRHDAWHLGAVAHDGEVVVASASFYRIPCRQRPGVEGAVQLRMMAVDARWQETGVGRSVLEAAIERLRRERAPLLWGNARDTALGFYQRLGFEIVGDSFIEPTTGLAHHVVVLDLVPPAG